MEISEGWLYMRKYLLNFSFFMLLLVGLASLGCTTMKNVETAEGTGHKKVFNSSFDSVWTATLLTLGTLPLNIEKNSKKEGQILAHRTVTVTSWGENVGIFIRKFSNTSTSLEVVSKKVVSGNIFATDWSQEIVEKVSSRLNK